LPGIPACRQAGNLYQKFRKLLFYPLNYGTGGKEYRTDEQGISNDEVSIPRSEFKISGDAKLSILY